MLDLLVMNAEKKYVVLFGKNSLEVSELLNTNAEKKNVLFGSNSLNVSQLLDINAEKNVSSIVW